MFSGILSFEQAAYGGETYIQYHKGTMGPCSSVACC